MSKRESTLTKAEEEADKLWKKQYDGDDADDKPSDTSEQEGGADDEPTDTHDEPVDDTDTQEPPVKVVSEDTWKQKFDTLLGKYNAEVPRFAAEVKQWKDNAIALADRVTELETKLSSAEVKAQVDSVDVDLTELEREYPDIGSYIRKLNDAHRKEIDELRKQVKSNLDNSISEVKSDITVSKQQAFDKQMADLGVPNWRQIDQMPEFGEWLNQPAGYGRFTKLVLLQDAARALDATTVSKFFLDFMKESTSSQEGSDNQSKFKNFIAPPRNEQGGKPKREGANKLTREMYTQFMRDSAKGKFNPSKWGGKTEAQVEAMFDTAIAQGSLS